MKKTLLFVFVVLFTTFSIHAEEYFNGKLIAPDKSETDILYDRTQLSITGGIFQSVYKVLSSERKLLYTVTITHDRQKSVMFFGLKTEGAGVKGFTVKYDPDSSGIIYNDVSNTDTSFEAKKAYRYLVSFTDANRDFPVLHKIKADEGNLLVLDPVSRIRIKMHKELLYKLAIAPTHSAQSGAPPSDFQFNSKDVLSRELYKARLDLFKLSNTYTELVSEIRNTLQKEIKERFKDNRVFADERKYSGDLRKGQPEGNGLLIEKGNIYQGIFKSGQLDKGNAAIKNNMFEYIGKYAGNSYNGIGWLKYANGSYLLGDFTNAVLSSGILLSKDKEDEIYYGSYKNNQRSGYGELRNSSGDFYFGEFLNGKLVKGYTKEVDQFGYATYSRIEKGTKTNADQQTAEEFFNAVLHVKN